MLVDYNADTGKHRFRFESWKDLFVVYVDQVTLVMMKTPLSKFYRYAYSDQDKGMYVYWSLPAYPFFAAWQYLVYGVWLIYLKFKK